MQGDQTGKKSVQTDFFGPDALCHVSMCRWHNGKESTCQCKRCKRCGFDPWVSKTPWGRKWVSVPVFLPGKFHGQWSLVGYSP